MVQLDKAITEKWELGVACILNLWPALSIAVANQWGGSDSEGKRDWFCGAIADLFTDAEGSGGETQKEPELDELDVEEVLLQVMQDEFEVGVDDDTSFAIAQQVVHLRGQILKGDHSGVEEWHKRWLERKGKNVIPAGISVVEREAEETDGDGDSTDEEEDVEMEDAPPATGSGGGVKEKPEPIVDEDGFELVQKRRR